MTIRIERPQMTYAMISSLLAIGCAAQASDTEDTAEIVDNLIQAGFREDDIEVSDGIVVVGGDAQVSLAASREMIADDGSGKEQFRSTNTVSRALSKICVQTSNPELSAGLDRAIRNYDEQPLTFAMVRGPVAGCSATITVALVGDTGASTGFPSGGMPWPQILLSRDSAFLDAAVLEYRITHELGHALGFRHTDFFNQSSCGVFANEGEGGVGAVHIPNTPGGGAGVSWFNTCPTTLLSDFPMFDVIALRSVYGVRPDNRYLVGDWDGNGTDTLAARSGNTLFVDVDPSLPGPELIQTLDDITGVEQFLIGDWDGDRRDSIAFRRGNLVSMYRDSNEPSGFNKVVDHTQGYGTGNTEDAYLVGDWGGVEGDKLAVNRGGLVLKDVNYNGAHDLTQGYGTGLAEDQYLVGDWDRDGRDNLAVRRGNVILMDTGLNQTFGAGNAEDQYLVGDWDGDGFDNIAVRRGNVVLMDTNFDDVVDITLTFGAGNLHDP